MKNKLEKIKADTQELCKEVSSDLTTTQKQLNQVSKEYQRVTEISQSPAVIIEEIDSQFEEATKLTKTDVAFLFLATALQCIRQYTLTAMPERLGDQEAAKKVKGDEPEHSDRKHRLYNPSLEEILCCPVPFDANMGTSKYETPEGLGPLKGFGPLAHRGATPGHDPIVGLVVGTANIATSTLTNWRMESFHIYTGTIGNARGKHDIFSKRAKTSLVSSYTIDKLLNQGTNGRAIIGASLAKEIKHLRSDLYSKDSLPLPIISVIDPKLAGELAKRGIDMANVISVGKQFTYALAIDALIALIHGFFYQESDVISRDMYEVRTRRILIYSNVIASASNALAAALMAYMGAEETAGKIIDWGGYLNTLHHLVFDTKFIHEVKKDFLKNELQNRIVGAQYDFMKGEF